MPSCVAADRDGSRCSAPRLSARRRLRWVPCEEEQPMRTLASFIVTSLDGFYEGSNGEFDWMIPDEEFNEFAVRQLDEADTLGSGGRRTNTWPPTGQQSRPE